MSQFEKWYTDEGAEQSHCDTCSSWDDMKLAWKAALEWVIKEMVAETKVGLGPVYMAVKDELEELENE